MGEGLKRYAWRFEATRIIKIVLIAFWLVKMRDF